jgi:hypothetical protein
MPPAGFDSAIPVSERPQTHALDRAATGIGYKHNYIHNIEIPKMFINNGIVWQNTHFNNYACVF